MNFVAQIFCSIFICLFIHFNCEASTKTSDSFHKLQDITNLNGVSVSGPSATKNNTSNFATPCKSERNTQSKSKFDTSKHCNSNKLMRSHSSPPAITSQIHLQTKHERAQTPDHHDDSKKVNLENVSVRVHSHQTHMEIADHESHAQHYNHLRHKPDVTFQSKKKEFDVLNSNKKYVLVIAQNKLLENETMQLRQSKAELQKEVQTLKNQQQIKQTK